MTGVKIQGLKGQAKRMYESIVAALGDEAAVNPTGGGAKEDKPDGIYRTNKSFGGAQQDYTLGLKIVDSKRQGTVLLRVRYGAHNAEKVEGIVSRLCGEQDTYDDTSAVQDKEKAESESLDPLISLHMQNLKDILYVQDVRPGKTVKKPSPLPPGVSEVRRNNGHYQIAIVGSDGRLEQKVTVVPYKHSHADLGCLLGNYDDCMGKQLNAYFARTNQMN